MSISARAFTSAESISPLDDHPMKLRLLDDSIRLRLSQSEVIAAREQGLVESQTRFEDGSVFTYALEAAKSAAAPSATYTRERMVVKLSAREIEDWANDDAAVSLRGTVHLADGGELKLLVEKDFKCVAPRDDDEDQSDLFHNRSTTC
jgi:hypothetical protein